MMARMIRERDMVKERARTKRSGSNDTWIANQVRLKA
jgi:hypothetical protein